MTQKSLMMNLNKSLSSLDCPEPNVYKTHQKRPAQTQQLASQKSVTTQFQLIHYHLGADLYSMITEKSNCYNDHTIVECQQRSQNNMAE